MKHAQAATSTAFTLLVCVGFLVAVLLLVAGFHSFRQAAYPWSDGSGHYVGLQLANESSAPVALGYRRGTEAEWQWVQGTRVDHRPSQWCTSVLPVEVIEPFVGPQPLMLRLECAPRAWSPPVELSVGVRPQTFVRVHISEQGQVSVAQGTESFVGYPSYAPERVVGAIIP
jgi:hypothetical protein